MEAKEIMDELNSMECPKHHRKAIVTVRDEAKELTALNIMIESCCDAHAIAVFDRAAELLPRK